MTLSLRSLNIPDIHRFAVGFDHIFDELVRQNAGNQSQNYPPYNVVKHSEDHFSIELAVAGFKNGDIDVTVEHNQLTVRGEQSTEVNSQVEYLYRGISSRNFVRTWTLADHVEVTGAVATDGILRINLERIIPEEKKPKKIAIAYNK
jgi:molecular chaperone IbpA